MNLPPIPSDRPGSSSRFKGVCKNGKNWTAQIVIPSEGGRVYLVQSQGRPHPTTTAPPRSMGMTSSMGTTTGFVSVASVSGPSSSTGVAQAPAGQASVLPGSMQQPLHSISTTISGQMPQSSASHMMNTVPIISTQTISGAAMSNSLPPGAGQPARAPQSNVAAVASTIPAAMQGRPPALPTSVAMMQQPSFVQGGAGLNLTNPMAMLMAMPMVANMDLPRGVPGNPMAAMTAVPLAPTGRYYQPCPLHTTHATDSDLLPASSSGLLFSLEWASCKLRCHR